MSIGSRIQSLRKQKGISQEELAEQLGVSRQAISKWESEQSTPDIDNVVSLSDLFAVTTDYLLKGVEPEKTAGHRGTRWDALSLFAIWMVWIGYIGCAALWYEMQNAYALLAGMAWMTGGCLLAGIARLRGAATERFGLFRVTSLPAISFFLLSMIYNRIALGVRAPYPLMSGRIVLLAGTVAVWLVINGLHTALWLRRR